MPIKDYSTDPDLNVSISGINIAEGCPPSGINNAIRQLMADVKVESEAVSEAVSETSSALEAFADQQAAKDEEQDEAIAEAKSSAEAAGQAAANAQASADAKLPLAGGEMTGDLGFKLDDLALAVIGTFLVSTRKVCGLYPRNGAEVHLGSMNEGETLETVACKRLAGPWARAIFGANEYNPDIVILHGYDEASGAGYIRFSSGLLFQWGRVNNVAASPTITTIPLHQPYKNGNYYVNCNQTYNWESGNRPAYIIGIIGLPSATSFNVSGQSGPLGATWFTLGVGA